MDDRASLFSVSEEVEGREEHVSLAGLIAWGADRASHHMRGQHQAGRDHLFQAALKGADSDDDGCDPGVFQDSGDVSHGHVADGSDRY
jgi:hypothetical protein